VTEQQELRKQVLGAVLSDTAPLQQMFSILIPQVGGYIERYKAGDLSLEELFFWQKSFARVFLSFVEALSYAINQTLLAQGERLQVPLSRTKRKELARATLSLEKRLLLSLTYFPQLLGIQFQFDASAEDRRALQVLIESRERFTHPKGPSDLRPPGLLAATMPAIEWFFRAWLLLVFLSLQSIGANVQEPSRDRRFMFTEDLLLQFTERLQAYERMHAAASPIKRLEEIIVGLKDDTSRALALLSGPPATPIEASFALRNVFLTIFSEIEGSVFALADWLHRYRPDYPCPTRELLTGTDELVRGRIADTLESFSREFGTNQRIKRTGPEWDSFALARRVRDQMTHPKRPSDWAPRPEDLGVAIAISTWWHVQVRDCLHIDPEKAPPLALGDHDVTPCQ
jgi:hypothetical protein